MNRLYELTSSYLQALDFLTDPENEVDQQTAIDTMENLEGDLDDKLLNVGRFIASIEAQANAIEEVERRQKARRIILENKAAWLRDYLQANMSTSGRDKITAPDIALKLAKLPVSVQIDDETKIPTEFWKEKVFTTIDKVGIKAAGGCAGVRIESAGFRVAIK
jgi:hypothetical protein